MTDPALVRVRVRIRIDFLMSECLDGLEAEVRRKGEELK